MVFVKCVHVYSIEKISNIGFVLIGQYVVNK